jgi:hypothetical protein
VTQASQKLHLPYTIRFMARLHEQAAQACESDTQSAGLQQEAVEMRAAAKTLDRPVMPVHEAADLPQKIKLLNWLRQSN